MGYRVFKPLNSTCRDSGPSDAGLGPFLPPLSPFVRDYVYLTREFPR